LVIEVAIELIEVFDVVKTRVEVFGIAVERRVIVEIRQKSSTSLRMLPRFSPQRRSQR